MAREKQFVFSARTTAEGLKALNEVKSCFNIGWDELVIDAVSAHYNLDKAMMTLPKKEAPAKPAKDESEQPPTQQQVTEEATTEVAPAEERPAEPADKKPAKKKAKGGKKSSKRAPSEAA